MARKSSDPDKPNARNSTGAGRDPSLDATSPAEGTSGAPIFVVVSDPSFFERVQTECTSVPPDLEFYPDVSRLFVQLESMGKFGLAFALFAERFGNDVDASEVRKLRLDFPQVIPLVILESCDQQCEHRLLSVGVHRIMLPPFGQIDLASEIATVAPNVPSFKRHPDLMNRGQLRLDLLIPSDLSYVLGINYEISMLLKEFGFPQQDSRINIPLACDEAITNAIVHGNKYQPDKKVNIQIYISNSRFRIRVRDQGDGFDFNSLADPRKGDNIHRSSGRGVFLMRNIMNTTEYKEGGCVLELEKLNPNAKRGGSNSNNNSNHND
ncbi:MAG: ATP-binding protein [Planctomycetota bacterium]|jgi:serine/threonine-protein kinase RsbW